MALTWEQLQAAGEWTCFDEPNGEFYQGRGRMAATVTKAEISKSSKKERK